MLYFNPFPQIEFMDFEKPDFMDFDSGLQENLFYLGVCVILVSGLVTANNLATDGDKRLEVGPTEVFNECKGLDVGICLGIERPNHVTYDYDDYNGTPEEGTEEYYRRVESELMIQAYNICEDDSLSGMDWLEEAEYDNRTGAEWYEMEEVDLLGCEQTFRFKVDE